MQLQPEWVPHEPEETGSSRHAIGIPPGQTPLRQAMTALAHAAKSNPQVPPQLQTAINQATRAMPAGVPATHLIANADRLVALMGFDAPDENVVAATRRLEQAAVEYRMWRLVRER